ncbi:MAG TPA: DEAD/DEAH box helicase [Gemmatimonadaceae bacterium]|nr:DEAD/DEAH box helicase [Gemmatimonadaceae bacterium]
MARRVAVTSPEIVRRLIAEEVLGDEHTFAQLGAVRLREHQRRAVARVKVALDTYGGALLADSVGLGKTYVALAASREFKQALVVGPAVLRDTWMESAARADARIRFVSTESLSRGGVPELPAGFVIVDEAHHFRNPHTRRYGLLARLTANTRVLLLTATPVHNRAEDLSALLSLFLGAAAASLTPEMLAHCVIRREHGDTALVLPRVGRMQRLTIGGDASVARAILALPPPLPPRDGGDAGSLIRLGLLHLWTSSDAAAVNGIRRRLAAGSAMREALAIGRLPARSELRSWVAFDGALQLGFTELLVEPSTEAGGAELTALDEHLAALRQLLTLIRNGGDRDALRASRLEQLRRIHPAERVLAFSSYSATVHALLRQLRGDGEVAVVTARGGWIASGRTKREDVLSMFRAPAHRRERIMLLLATDLLSEGLDLQEASIIVHLDLPWTAARLEQRVGRARRPGSARPVVRSYAFVQPACIERLIGKERIILGKARTAGRTVGALLYGGSSPRTAPSPPRAAEDARRILVDWSLCAHESAQDTRVRVAAVSAPEPGFLALIRTRHGSVLLAGFWNRRKTRRAAHGSAGHRERPEFARALTVSTDPALIHDVLAEAGGPASPVVPRSYLAARRAIALWLADESVRCATAWKPAMRGLRRIVQRLEAALTTAPLHLRSDLAARVGHVRSALSSRLPRGLEMAIAERVRSIADDYELVRALENVLADPPESHRTSAGELIALLLLEPEGQRIPSANAISSVRRA